MARTNQIHSQETIAQKEGEQTGIGEGIINDQDIEQKGKDILFFSCEERSLLLLLPLLPFILLFFLLGL